MNLLVQQSVDEYMEDQRQLDDLRYKNAALEEVLSTTFTLEAGKEVVVLRNDATRHQVAGKRGVVLEVREPDGLWSTEQWPVVVHLDGTSGGLRYLFSRNEVAVVG